MASPGALIYPDQVSPVDAPAAPPQRDPLVGVAPALRVLLPEAFGAVATVWQRDAAAAGVTIRLDPQPFDVVLRRAQAGDFDGVLLSLSADREQDLTSALHSPPLGTTNYGGCHDADTDALLEEIARTADPAARAEREHRLHRRLHELQPMTIVMGDVRTAVAARRLQGVRMDAFGAAARRMSITP